MPLAVRIDGLFDEIHVRTVGPHLSALPLPHTSTRIGDFNDHNDFEGRIGT